MKIMAILNVFMCLLCILSFSAYSKVNWIPLELSFNNRISEVITLPYPIRDGSRNGGSTERYYFLRKDGKPYTIEQGTCSVIGQQGSPGGSFTYKFLLNDRGIWVGYISSNHYPQIPGIVSGILVQCVENKI